jgi:hypothetical protein
MATAVQIVALFLALSLGTGGCKEHCEVTPGLYEAYREAIIYPERFDTYLDQTPVNDQLYDCLGSTGAKAAQIAEQMRQDCDDAHTEGSEFWHRCYSEVENYEVIQVNLPRDIQRASRGTSLFADTPVGIQLITIKSLDPAFHEEAYTDFFQRAETELRSLLTCERCEDRFLGISFDQTQESP